MIPFEEDLDLEKGWEELDLDAENCGFDPSGVSNTRWPGQQIVKKTTCFRYAEPGPAWLGMKIKMI